MLHGKITVFWGWIMDRLRAKAPKPDASPAPIDHDAGAGNIIPGKLFPAGGEFLPKFLARRPAGSSLSSTLGLREQISGHDASRKNGDMNKIWPLLGLGGLFLLMTRRTIHDVTDQLPKAAGATYGTRNLSQITRYVIHHSATKSGDPWSFAKYHVETNGWPGIGYAFVILKTGKIYQTNRLETISYNVANNNTGSLGICLEGDYEKETPPTEQINALIWLIKHLSEKLGQKPILPHKALSSTSCPGSNVNIEYIKKQVYG
jgi:hypothetical protein